MFIGLANDVSTYTERIVFDIGLYEKALEKSVALKLIKMLPALCETRNTCP
jgi:hypothetical protein